MNTSGAHRVLGEWHRNGRGRGEWLPLLQARAALMDACEAIIGAAEVNGRGLMPDERRTFDEHRQVIGEINSELAGYKRSAVADVVGRGFPAEYCRLPF